MYEKCVNEAELILTTQKDALAPVHKIWKEVVRRAKVEGFAVASLSDFSAMLEGDRRFLIIPAQIKNQEDREAQTDPELEDSEMEVECPRCKQPMKKVIQKLRFKVK